MPVKFRAVSSYRFFWPIVVKTPDPAKPGEFVEATFEAEFVMHPAEERSRIQKEITDTPGMDEVRSEVEFMKRALVGWRGIAGENDQDLPFQPETVHMVLQDTFARRGLYTGYFAAMNGNAAQLGN